MSKRAPGPKGVSGSNEDQAGTLKDAWGSPVALVNRIDARFEITGDMCAATNQHLYDECRRKGSEDSPQADLFGRDPAVVVLGDTAIRPNGRRVPWCGPGHPNEEMRDALTSDLSALGARPYCNPTYSNIGPFADRMVDYVMDDPERWGFLLVKSAHATAWFSRVHRWASAMWTFSKRLAHLQQRFDGLARIHVGGSNIESTLLIFSGRGPDVLGPRYGVLDGDTFEPVTKEGRDLWRCMGPKTMEWDKPTKRPLLP